MSDLISRRELVAASLCLPAAVPGASGPARAWNRPVPLGNSGLAVTPLGISPGAKDAKVIVKAVDLGINHVNIFAFYKDTSEFPFVGEALKSVRRKVVLGAGSGETTREGVLSQIDARLRVFGTDHIDLWYLCSPNEITDGMLEAVAIARQAGKIRACGVSTHKFAKMVPRILELRKTVSALMVACNFATWDGNPWAEHATNIAKVRQAGIGIVAMKAMLGGLDFVQSGQRAWADALKTDPSKKNAALVAALKWILRNDQVDSSPVSMSGFEQLERNVQAAAEPFTDDDRRLLAAELARITPYYCRMCGSCEGACRKGLPVADLMRFSLYARGYGRPEIGRGCFGELPRHLQVVRCANCDGCTVRCPNGVEVARELGRAQAALA